ncbi:hypothetical protein ACYZUD_22355 [Pseudomonas sp. XS1P51]
MNPDLDKRGSKNSCLPNSTLLASVIFAGCTGKMGSLEAASAGAVPPSINPKISINGLYMAFSQQAYSLNHHVPNNGLLL